MQGKRLRMDNEEGESDEEVDSLIKQTIDDASSTPGSNESAQSSITKVCGPSSKPFTYYDAKFIRNPSHRLLPWTLIPVSFCTHICCSIKLTWQKFLTNVVSYVSFPILAFPGC